MHHKENNSHQHVGHTEVDIEIELADGATPPHYASSGAAGADLRAHITAPIILEPQTSTLVPTGIRVSIPTGYEIQIRPRSGLALRDLITVLNSPGTVDSDYRGELQVILINHGRNPFVIQPQMRIAQMILAPVCRAHFVPNSQLSITTRGNNGFGHTGTH